MYLNFSNEIMLCYSLPTALYCNENSNEGDEIESALNLMMTMTRLEFRKLTT